MHKIIISVSFLIVIMNLVNGIQDDTVNREPANGQSRFLLSHLLNSVNQNQNNYNHNQGGYYPVYPRPIPVPIQPVHIQPIAVPVKPVHVQPIPVNYYPHVKPFQVPQYHNYPLNYYGYPTQNHNYPSLNYYGYPQFAGHYKK